MKGHVLCISVLCAVVSPGCSADPDPDMVDPLHAQGPSHPPAELGLPPNPVTASQRGRDRTHFPVPAPPITADYWPCSDCHEDEEVNPTRRRLREDHEGIVLEHDEENRWCLDCHDKDDRDHLRLASGKKIRFDESYQLCGQCHGEKLRDWKAGVHGKRTGKWRGEKRYLLCAHCHDPHSPRFRPLKPESAPVRPEDIR